MIYKKVMESSNYNYNTHNYQNKKTIKYIITARNKNGVGIKYEYQELDSDLMEKTLVNALETGNLFRPKYMSIESDISRENLKREATRYSSSRASEFLEIQDKTPEEIGLFIPNEYIIPDTITSSIERTSEINDEIFEKLKRLNLSKPIAIIGENHQYVKNSSDDDILKAWCPHCHKLFTTKENYYGRTTCPYCKLRDSKKSIVDIKFKQYRKDNYDTKNYTRMDLKDYQQKCNDKVYYMVPVENGIILYKIAHEVSIKDGKYVEKYSIDYSIEHIVGKNMKAYKHLRNSKRECDPFEALSINTQNFNNPPDIIYDGATTFLQFAKNNEKTMRMFGFMEVLKYSPKTLRLDAFFIVFLGIMNRYPVMEQIVKMGHAKLFFELYNQMENSLNKDEIENKVASLAQLVDNNATKGKEALRFPPYVGDYLIKKGASLDEYYYWRDISEITNISKESFIKMVDSFDFAYVNSQVGFSDIGNILKYGYEPSKLLSYLVKNSSYRGMDWVINTLSDYLAMSELMEVTPDKYPMDLSKQHDDLAVSFGSRNGNDYILTKIGMECEKYFENDTDDDDKIGRPKLFNDYTVIFPKSERDFIDEGNQQHNCVGSYPRNVKRGNCVIFFIRKKEDPGKSFITGECTRSGLGQLLFSNNRYIDNPDLVALGRYVANKIKRGVISGTIHALDKVPSI